jgi:RNA polymerase sigma factor (sigma-70 family)
MNVLSRTSGSDDEWAVLEEAYGSYRPQLLKLATLLSGSSDGGADLVQEAFLRAGDRLAGVGKDRIHAYLRRTLLNVWRSHLRRQSLERQLLRKAADPYLQYMIEDPDYELLAAVGRLSPRQRSCIVLRFYEDMSYAEIATALGCSEGSVKTHIHRALTILRKERFE